MLTSDFYTVWGGVSLLFDSLAFKISVQKRFLSIAEDSVIVGDFYTNY